MPFFVYILRSIDNQLYIGQTNNLHNREKQHLTKDWKAAKFTKDGDGFKLVYHEELPSRLEAMRRETQLKGWSRAKKEALINGDLDKLKLLSKSR
ncbi:MAG: GIY-YIG nuclease family protein [Patescibacteria group bacterium]